MQFVGKARANAYRRRAPGLAQLVERCWQVSPDVTVCVSRPLAEAIDRHLPEAAKSAVDVGLEPVSVLIGAWRILTHCQEQERHAIAAYRDHMMMERAGRAEGAQEVPDAPQVDAPEQVQQSQSFDLIGASGEAR